MNAAQVLHSVITFVDARVPNLEFFLQNLPAGAELAMLDPSRDGLAQMAEALAGRQGLSAVHIVSHGSPGALYLGNTFLDSAGLDSRSAELAALGRSLSSDGDILLYGCSVAEGAAGQAFVSKLAGLTGADVAASDDATGAAALGGDWTLDSQTGPVESAALLDQPGLAAYDGLLSGGGWLTMDFSGAWDQCRGMALQADGKILMAGTASGDFALIRYTADGVLDATFSQDGKVTTDFNSWDDGSSVAIQPDGKILVAGVNNPGSLLSFALARYNPDGSLDATFSDDGKVITGFNTGDHCFGKSVAVQPDGKVLVAGWTGKNPLCDFALARYNPDGSLDASFNGNGKVVTDFGHTDIGNSVALQPDGKILVAGYTQSTDSNGNYIDIDFALARYNVDGTLDATFSGDGKTTTEVDFIDTGYSVLVQPDGKILVAGSALGHFTLVRYNADGNLDWSFGQDGKAHPSFGGGEFGYAAAFQADGKILVAGQFGTDDYGDFGLVRFNQNGSLDTSFGDSGKASADLLGLDEAHSVVVQPDGKILVAGDSRVGNYDSRDVDFALVRFNADGSIDTSFPVNVAPTGNATAQLPVGAEDIPYQFRTIDLLQGFSDANGDTLSIADLSALHGSVASNGNGLWLFTPEANYNGPVTLSYTVSDGQGGNASAQQSFSLTPANDAPSGSPAAPLPAGTEDTAYTLVASDLLQGFTDVDGDTLSVTGLAATHGVLAAHNDGTWAFTPEADYNGAVALSYSVADGHGGLAKAQQGFVLEAVNDAPRGKAAAVLAAGTEDTPYLLKAADLLSSFSDPEGNSLSVIGLSADHGSLANNGDGTWTLTPPVDYNGKVVVSYGVSDGQGGTTAAQQSFTLALVNDGPPAGSASAALPDGLEDTAYALVAADLLRGFTDMDGDLLSVTSLTATHGSLVANGTGIWTFTPEADYNGGVALSYNVADGHGGLAKAQQGFVLDAVNDAPRSKAAAPLPAGTEDTMYTVTAAGLLQGFFDPDGDPLSVAGLSATHGQLTGQGDGPWNFVPDPDYNGAVDLKYSVMDGHGGVVPAQQSFVLKSVNDAAPAGSPQASLPPGTEDLAYLIKAADLLQGFSDADGDPLTVTGLSATHGSLLSNGDATWTFTPDPDYNGPVRLDYDVSDGQSAALPHAQLSFVLAAVNDVPAGMATATLATGSEDTAYTVKAADLLQGYSDADGDPLAVAGLACNHGKLAGNPDGTWTFQPTRNYNGPVTLGYTVSDGHGGTLAAHQSFALAAVNDPPALDAASFLIPENSAKGTAVGQAQGKDVDSATLSYSLASGNADWDGDGQPAFAIDPKTGALSVNDGGDLDFERHPQFKLGVQVSDGSLSATALATVKLGDVVEVPVGTAGVTVTPLQAPAITTENNALVTGQPGGAATFRVVLNSQPDSDVVLSFASGDETEGKPDHPVLTFTHADWNVPQILTVRGVDDLDDDGDVAYSVYGKVASDDIRYIRGVVIDNLILVNRDDPEDQPKVGYGDANAPSYRDQWTGGNGADIYYAGRDIDFVHGGLGNDQLYGQEDNDKLWGEGGNDTLWGGYGADQLDGGAGGDKLYGEQDNDTLAGGDGDDLLDGGQGADQMAGGNGADTYYVDDKGDVIDDQGADSAADTVLVPVFLSYTLGASIENGRLVGADNSSLVGNGLANVLIGNSGNNVLDGGGGKDILAGDAGNDTLKGGPGSDTADYSAATAAVNAGLATGKASGQGVGIDTLSAIENLLGGMGNDTLAGDAGINSLVGGAGNDALAGGAGNDSLAGNNGADTLQGGDGSDRLHGGSGKDTLTGGDGADRYVYSAVTDTGLGGAARDLITDFSVSQGDKLDLSAMDAKPGKAGIQSWSFVADFTGTAGQVSFDEANHLALFDRNGDGQADVQVELAGVSSLAASDFVL
jgi:uncharacterized delta-60 repeat protein